MSRFSPDKDLPFVGGNGMAELGKYIFKFVGILFLLGIVGQLVGL